MCLIYCRPEHTINKPDWGHLEEAFDRNPHGFGYVAWDYEKGKWESNKTVQKNTWKDVKRYIKILNDFTDHFAVHFRWATRGPVVRANAHPFNIGKNEYLMHNGTVYEVKMKKGSHLSDSRLIANGIKKTGCKAILDRNSNNNRFLIARKDGFFELIGEWHEREDGYYSKLDYLPNDCAKWWDHIDREPITWKRAWAN